MVCWSASSALSIRVVFWENCKSLLRRRSALRRPAKVKPYITMQAGKAMETAQNDEATQTSDAAAATTQSMSKNAQKRLLKQRRFEEKKAEKKAQLKEHKKREAERKRREWAERLTGVGEEEREKLIEERRALRKERMEKRTEEKGKKIERLREARASGQNLVIDLEFAHLMNANELQSLVQQIMYCYAVNGRCVVPAHIWLTGCQGEMQNQLLRIPGYDKWLIEKEEQSYVEAFKDHKENLVYLTADSENVLDELDPKAVYIIGGLVDRNRWKGITMKKATEQGIRTAKLPIGAYLKMSSSQVLTVNQVVEILLKFLETRDWKDSFFQVIPLRKRCEGGITCDGEELECRVANEGDGACQIEEAEAGKGADDREVENLDNGDSVGIEDQKVKRQCIETEV